MKYSIVVFTIGGAVDLQSKVSWSMELCKIMIMMLDRNKDGIMQYTEFKELLQCLLHWHQLFKTCADQDRSGYVEANELLNINSSRHAQTRTARATSRQTNCSISTLQEMRRPGPLGLRRGKRTAQYHHEEVCSSSV